MIPIVFSTDHNYVMPTGVTILSLLMSNPQEVFDIFILCGMDVTDVDKSNLTRQVELYSKESKINFLNLDNAFSGSHEIRDISIACYYRLLIPWLIPQYDKIIYSDVDILFMGNIAGLYNLEVEGYVAGVNTPGFSASKRTSRYIENLGLNPQRYINSGFLLINAKKQRDDNLQPKYLEHSKRKYLFQDQDILNIVTAGEITYLPLIYNAAPSRIAPHSELKFEDVVVVHYAGDKPWKTFTLRWREWWNFYDKSIFYDNDFCESVATKILDNRIWLNNQWKKFKSKYFHR